MSIVVKAGAGLVAGIVAGLLGLAFMAEVAPNAVKPRLAVESPHFVVASASAPPNVQTAAAIAPRAPAPPPAIIPAANPPPDVATIGAVKLAEPAPRAEPKPPVKPAVAPSPSAVAEAPKSPSQEAAARWSVPGLIALAKGDLSTARLFLARAAEAGDARAWVALADTFDPAMLAKLGVVGAPGDPQRARDYLGKAAAAGIVVAKDRMAALEQASGSVR